MLCCSSHNSSFPQYYRVDNSVQLHEAKSIAVLASDPTVFEVVTVQIWPRVASTRTHLFSLIQEKAVHRFRCEDGSTASLWAAVLGAHATALALAIDAHKKVRGNIYSSSLHFRQAGLSLPPELDTLLPATSSSKLTHHHIQRTPKKQRTSHKHAHSPHRRANEQHVSAVAMQVLSTPVGSSVLPSSAAAQSTLSTDAFKMMPNPLRMSA